MLYQKELFGGGKVEAVLSKRFEYTNDVVFDLEDFAVAEEVQKRLRFGDNDFHTL
ncbi:SRPBCC family protein [Ochrobactrum chromiisoli]|uniref:Uncharacterized protein n=1 Tax=Ochrobactrum chromiisoli TaxID=2993941 RepID=A0ABT3QR63_9HYPH|nr:hypothetical protein [Ochrobactrum chromiisoli]MCX2698111.1 hypothetical protein [Ochrobactrum chromiisoli]